MFGALLLLYPAAVRDEYGREMSLVFADRYRDAGGAIDRVRLWLEVVAGILLDAPREHARVALHDLRYAGRRLRQSPAFAITSIAVLAIAIGVSTTMFSVVNAVLLRPLPVAASDRLVTLWTGDPGLGARPQRTAYGSVEEWRSRSRRLDGIAVFDPVSAMLTTAGETEQASLLRVSPDLLPLLGVTPIRGRLFSAREAEERQRLVLISHRFWQSRFGGADDAIGSRLVIDGATSEIVGVLPASLATVFGSDVWQPHTLFADWEARRAARGAGPWFVVARLAPGATTAQVREEMRGIATALGDGAAAAGGSPGISAGISIVPLAEYITGGGPRLTLWMLTAAAVALLLVAAANVAGLSLARGIGRVPEMAIRAALGASRARLVHQLLAESITLAAVAGGVGLLLAAGGIRMVRAFAPAGVPRIEEVGVDWRVLLWTVIVSAGAGIVVGLAPALTIWRRDLRSAAVEGGRSVAGGAATRARRVLVVVQCAVAIVLLAGAGLLARSWWNLMLVDPGFRPEHVLSLAISTPSGMPDGRRGAFYEQVAEAAGALPGVLNAGVSSELFVTNAGDVTLTAEGAEQAAVRLPLRRDEVAGDVFATLQTPLLRGRTFSAADGPTAARVAIINEAMAQQVWGSRDPIGRRLTFNPSSPNPTWFTVVGVVGNMRRQGLEIEATPQMFEALAQNPSRRAILFVRSGGDDPSPLVPLLRAAVRGVDANAVIYGVTTADARLGALLAPRRLQTSLLAAFSLAALLLATLGIYGVIQYSVAARTHEIGIRMALGASLGDVFRMVVREGLVLSAAGLVLGVFAALWLTRLGATLLYGVTPTDPLTFAAASLLMVAVAAAASWLPARRATRIAPIVALQQRR